MATEDNAQSLVCKCGHTKVQHVQGVCFVGDCFCYEYATARKYLFTTGNERGGKTSRLQDELIDILRRNHAHETSCLKNGLHCLKFELGGEVYLFVSRNEITSVSDSERIRQDNAKLG